MFTIWLSIFIAAAIILGLSIYAAKLLLQLKKQNDTKKAQIAKRNKTLADSIDVIANAMLQGQCDYSEGTIRICVLLDHLKPVPAVDFVATYPNMHKFYDQIKNFDTHEKRNALPKNERMKQDIQRLKFEAESKPAIEREELPKLREFIGGML